MSRKQGRGGFFAIGIYQPKTEANIGSLWRAAFLYDASFIFTIGARYKRQASDTPKTPNRIPLMAFLDFDMMRQSLPWSCLLVGVELDERAVLLGDYVHPDRACYLLGAEDNGLPPTVIEQCHQVVQIETPNPQSMNVACAGSILMRDRYVSRKGAA